MLITANDIRKHRPIASNLDDEKRLNTYIEEAERLDIMPAIGVKLFKDISENPNDHEELLNGGYYDDDKRHSEGLKAALCMLAYSRFILNNPVNVTSFGVHWKNTSDSDPVDDKTLFRHGNEAKKVGEAYLRQCVDYLQWKENSCRPARRVGRSKFKVIGE